MPSTKPLSNKPALYEYNIVLRALVTMQKSCEKTVLYFPFKRNLEIVQVLDVAQCLVAIPLRPNYRVTASQGNPEYSFAYSSAGAGWDHCLRVVQLPKQIQSLCDFGCVLG